MGRTRAGRAVPHRCQPPHGAWFCSWSGHLRWMALLIASKSLYSQTPTSGLLVVQSWSSSHQSVRRHSSFPKLGNLRGGGDDEEEEDESWETKVPEGYWKNPRTGRYKDLPDDETAIQWRIADWYLDRRGAGSKERHEKSRESGKHLIAQQMSLRKRPLESRRDKQGDNAYSRNVLSREMLSFTETMFAGTRSGLIADADFSDVFGKRWYETEDGQEYLRQQAELQAYAAQNASCYENARYFGRTPEQVRADRPIRQQLRRELAEQLQESVQSTSSLSESDSVGERLDWGWKMNDDGTFEKLGNWNFTDRGPHYTPKILRYWKIPESAYRKLY